MLASELERLGRRRDELADLGDALLALRSQVATEDSPVRLGVEVLEQPVAAPVLGRIAMSVGQVDSVFLDGEVGAVTDVEHASHALDRARDGQRQRTIYTRAVIDVADSTRRLDALRNAGQEQHVAETFEHEFAIFGDEVVVTPRRGATPARPTSSSATPCSSGPSRAGSTTCGARHRRATTAHRSTSASPSCSRSATGRGHRPPPGVALRTVRRRVAGLMDDYQVHTRFQLGRPWRTTTAPDARRVVGRAPGGQLSSRGGAG
ncbi:hypothetical protein [Janibacter melonis]|uniref:hypothetical protein n=1 Tax=Janibacter melonis TaxID=262209 RepID=UPI00209404E4|nr:hypothetical protein [Janibacter melonis]